MMDVLSPIVVLGLLLAALAGFALGWWIRGRRMAGRELTLKRQFDNRLSAVEQDARHALERARLESEASRRKIEAERDRLYTRLSKLDPEGSGLVSPSPRARLSRTQKIRKRQTRPASAAERARARAAGDRDDLTRIKGIGPAFEARLNEMGYRTYRDLARWTSEDLDTLGKGLGARIRLKEWSDRAAELHRREYDA
jgi:predicted flap endonuclease-1-like 5' DNA nuclease